MTPDEFDEWNRAETRLALRYFATLVGIMLAIFAALVGLAYVLDVLLPGGSA